MTVSTERAVLAGGCFWGVQDLLRRYPGVISTRVGYSGGEVPNATYRNHGNHAEAIEIIFDPKIIAYRKLQSGEYRLYSRKVNPKNGKRRNLGTFKSRAAAEKHEREVQYFKRH